MSLITVITPAPTANLIDLATVKLYMGITDSSQDAVLNSLIASASSSIQAFVGKTFGIETLNEKLPGTGARTLVLNKHPLQSIAFVKQDGVTVTDYDILDASAAVLVKKSNVWEYSGYYDGVNGSVRVNQSSRNNFEVQYTAGYSTIPGDIVNATFSLVKSLYSSRTTDTAGISSEAVSGVYSVTYRQGTNGFPPDVFSVISGYKSYAL